MTNEKTRRTLLDMLYYCWDSVKNAQPGSWEKIHFQAYAEALTETMRWIGEVTDPCKDCPTRKMLAKLCDFHDRRANDERETVE